MFNNRWITVGIICLVFIFNVNNSYFVFAQTIGLSSSGNVEIEILNTEITARKDKIKQLEESIGKYRKNIEQMQLQSVSLKNQLGILDNQIARLRLDLEITGEQIEQTELEIQALLLSIKEKESVIERQRALVSNMVKDIYVEKNKNYLNILLTSESFSEFYNQIQYLTSIYADLGRSMQRLRLSKQELEDKKQQVELRQRRYEALKGELLNKKAAWDEESNYKKKLLLDTNASEKKFRTLLESLKRQYQVVENEIRVYEDQVRRRLAESNKLQNQSDLTALAWPVPSRYITARFQDPDYPFRNVFEHSGMDIRASQGTLVMAAASGYVGRAKRCSSSSCYSYILLVHTSSLSTLYGHLSGIAVSEDQFVNKGDVIGYTGGTPGTVGAGPFVTGPHLHFETRLNGIPVDPINYLL